MNEAIAARESASYRAARNRLLEEEIALRRMTEAVADHRRRLPPGPPVPEDYILRRAGSGARVRFSELFGDGDALLVYCYMYPRHRQDTRDAAAAGETAALPRDEQPCPSCTTLLDQLDPASKPFAAAGGRFVIAADTSPDHLARTARDRGWRHLELLSSQGTRLKADHGAIDEDGQQKPMMLSFRRDADGTLRLAWRSELVDAPSEPGQDHRATGTLDTFWNLFDLTPGGRPDFQEQLQYGCCRTGN